MWKRPRSMAWAWAGLFFISFALLAFAALSALTHAYSRSSLLERNSLHCAWRVWQGLGDLERGLDRMARAAEKGTAEDFGFTLHQVRSILEERAWVLDSLPVLAEWNELEAITSELNACWGEIHQQVQVWSQGEPSSETAAGALLVRDWNERIRDLRGRIIAHLNATPLVRRHPSDTAFLLILLLLSSAGVAFVARALWSAQLGRWGTRWARGALSSVWRDEGPGIDPIREPSKTSGEAGGGEGGTIPLGVVLCRGGGVIEYVNDMALRIMGLQRPEEILGRTCEEVHRERMNELGGKEVELAAQTDPTQLFLDSEGRPISIQRTEIPLELGKENAVLFGLQDLRDTRRFQRQLLDQKEWLEVILESITDAVVSTDAHGMITFMNPVALALSGQDPNQVLGRPVRQVLPIVEEGTGRLLSHPVDECLREEHPMHSGGNSALSTGGGTLVPVDDKAAPIFDHDGYLRGAVLVLRDNSEQRAVARTLEESENKYRQMFEFSPEAIVLLDRNGTVLDVNKRVEDLLGYSRADAIGKGLISLPFFPWRSKVKVLSRFAKRLSNRNLPPYELEFITRSGERKVGLVRATLMRSADGRDVKDLVMVMDITMQKRIEESLRRRDAILEAVARSSEALLRNKVWEENADEVLRMLGQATGVSRVYIFKHLLGLDGEKRSEPQFEWHTGGARSYFSLAGYQSFSLAEGRWTRWTEILERGDVIAGNTEGFPEDERDQLRAIDTLSLIIVPVFLENSLWGILGFDDCENEREWSSSEIEAIKAGAATLGAVLYRARSEQRLIEARRRVAEVASRIQQNLLLGQIPFGIPRLEIATLAIPSEEVDGDFYEFIEHGEQHLDIMIGDVMGKGLPAALLGAGAKSQLMQAVWKGLQGQNGIGMVPMSRVMEEMHRRLVPQLIGLDSFMTVFYGRFDLERGELDFIDCGHTKTLCFRADQGISDTIEGSNMPLGFAPQEVYEEFRTSIRPGDVFLLYSDGVTEAMRADGEMFGLERLREFLTTHQALGPGDLLRQLRQTVEEFLLGARLGDDFTCIAVRIRQEESSAPTVLSMQMRGGLADLAELREFVGILCNSSKEYPVSEEQVGLLQLAVNEAAANIIEHGHPDGLAPVLVEGEIQGWMIRFRLFHHGIDFTPPEVIDTHEFDLEQFRGFGLGIMSRILDDIRYTVEADGRKCVTLEKDLRVSSLD